MRSLGFPGSDDHPTPGNPPNLMPLRGGEGGRDPSSFSPVATMPRHKGSKEVPAATRAAIAVSVHSTVTNAFISFHLKLPLSTVATIAARVRREGTAGHRRRSVRPRLLSARDARILQLLVYRHRSWSLAQLTQDFNPSVALPVIESTVRRYVHRACLRSYAAVTKPVLTPGHVAQRRRWARNKSSRTPEDWGKASSDDESTFTVRPPRGEAHVWRLPTDRYLPACLRPSFKSGLLSLSVWGGSSARGRTPLVHEEGRLNQHKYIDIWHNYLFPFAEAKNGGTSNFKLLDDNCGPHRDGAVRFYMALSRLERVDWVPQSPDMSPIENAWSFLERRLRARPTPPTTLNMLFDALCEECDRLPDSLFAGLSEGMPRRVGSLAVASGHSTKC